MAVQAQYPSNAFTPDFRNSSRSRAAQIHPIQQVLEEFEMQQLQERDDDYNKCNDNIALVAAYATTHHLPNNNGTAVFSDPHSELTCNGNASGSRKRNRVEESSSMTMTMPAFPPNHNTQQRFRYPNVAPSKTAADASISTGLHLSNRLIDSAATSTSGRALSQDIVSHLYHHNIEIEALIRQQNERLRLGVEDARKRHCRALASVVEQEVVKRLKDMELELQNANRRNAELEEKVRQMSAESQIWFNVAKNNEAIVCTLKTSLQHLLLQNLPLPVPVPVPAAKEGYGDSDGTPFPADDAHSCCFEDKNNSDDAVAVEEVATARETNQVLRGRKTCKSCGANDVSVLLLPCRHLCLCKDCESMVETCPICSSTKNACLQIFIS